MSYDDYVCGPDEFDDHRSQHVTAWRDEEPLGMVRLTLEPPFALAKWSEGQFRPPEIPGIVEMTRGVVHPNSRLHGVYKALMFESMLQAESLKKTTVIAAVEPGFVGKPFLHSLGFVDLGHPGWFDHHFFAQPLLCELRHRERWLAMYRTHAMKMTGSNVQINSRFLSAPT